MKLKFACSLSSTYFYKTIIVLTCIAIFFMLLHINRLSNKIRYYCYEKFEDTIERSEETEESIIESTKCPDSKNIKSPTTNS